MTTNSQVNGCFISLGGVNGNVWGNYKALKENKKDNIELITGEDLEGVLLKAFPSQTNINSYVEQQTSRKILSRSIAYYNKQIYWIFSLTGNTFTTLDDKGIVLEESDKINKMLFEIISGEYIDLKLEKERLNTEINIESKIYAVLCTENRRITKEYLKNETRKLLMADGKELNIEIFNEKWNALLKLCYIEVADDTIRFNLTKTDNKIVFFKSLFSVGALVTTLSSDLFINLFDLELVDDIQKIQQGISFSKEEKEICLKIISLSPSALMVAINEIELITHHRKTQKLFDLQLEEHDRNLFFRMIFEGFMKDFENPQLSSYYFNHKGLEELDFSFDVKFKKSSGIHIEHKNRKRLGIAKFNDDTLVKILILNNSPEPWER